MANKKWFLLLLLPFLVFMGCGKKDNRKYITIQASSAPHVEILEFIRADVEEDGVLLKIVVMDDYNIPNRALDEGEIDANFFQHKPFLEEQVKQFGYKIASLSDVHFEPMGIYGSWDLIKKGGLITVPSDPTNEGRALFLLEKGGVITLKKGVTYPTVLDIVDNPYGCTFKEVEAAFLARTVDEVAGSVIPTNYALLAGLYPKKDGLLIEDSSSYANIITVQEKDLEKPELLILKKHLESDKMKSYIEATYQGAIVPAN
jgi:D-methionine transport system substrate-binding protein